MLFKPEYLPPRDERKISPQSERGRQVFFYLLSEDEMQPFTKPALSAHDLVVLLQQRGLNIPDMSKAERYINTIGYYRLSAYFLPFYDQNHTFSANTTFDDVLSLYIFDRKLRLITLDPIQRIEIAVRSAISNYMSLKDGPFWHLNHNLFEDFEKYHNFIRIAFRHAGRTHTNPSLACTHYFTKYNDKPLPPSWILIEELPMGCWSKLFSNLKDKQDKRAIANSLNFAWRDFESWLKTATIIRNNIAHHRTFWNVTIPIHYKNANKYIKGAGNISGSYSNFVFSFAFLKRFTNNSEWNLRLAKLVNKECPLDIHTHMNFPQKWEELPFWK